MKNKQPKRGDTIVCLKNLSKRGVKKGERFTIDGFEDDKVIAHSNKSGERLRFSAPLKGQSWNQLKKIG